MDSRPQHFGAETPSDNNVHRGKRKADNGTPIQTRAKRNRYISIAWYMHPSVQSHQSISLTWQNISNECKRRKIKCNGETPCQRCGNLSLDCIYAPNCCTGGFRDSEWVNIPSTNNPCIDSIDREFRSVNASLHSLQEQVDNLYAQLSALRGGQDHGGIVHQSTSSYPIHPSLEQENSRNVFQRVRSPLHQGPRHAQFQGPTSSAYGFEVANSSLQTMGITQPDEADEHAAALDKDLSVPASQNQELPASMTMHPDKDPLWSFSKDEAVRLCRVYHDEMGIMYPIVNIEETISRTKFLFTFTESAARTGLISFQKPGPDALGSDDNNILKMVLATALTVEGNGESQLGKRLFHSVKDSSQNRLWSSVELKGLTLLVIIAQYHFHSDDELQAYRIIGLAARLCLEMGFHRREMLVKTLMSEEERSHATKLFWSIYVLDRRWSFGTGMPFVMQDTDIDPQIPEPDDRTPYLTAMIPYTRLSAKVWYAVIDLEGNRTETNKDTIGYLDYQIVQWHRSLPQTLRYNNSYDDAGAKSFDKNQRRLQIVLYLRANQMRMLLYRPILHSVTSIMENHSHAQTAVGIAKDTVRALTSLNQNSDIYRTQQVCFNHFIVSALAVIFLAVAHAPVDFSRQVRDEFYMALELVKGFSTKSYVSKRLWKTIKGLKEIGPKLGLVSRQTLTDGSDPHSSAAVAMAGLAGHRVDEMAAFNPSQGSGLLGSAPVDGQQMSLELTNLFEASGGYGNMMASNAPGCGGTNGIDSRTGDTAAEDEAMGAVYGQDGDFAKLIHELF
ncbi:MAG: hypothetical protein Q9191_000415 [Dirinaria sp. TL-2023a]